MRSFLSALSSEDDSCAICRGAGFVRLDAQCRLVVAPRVLVPAQLLHGATFGAFHAASVAAVQRAFPEAAQARGQALLSSFGYGAGGAAGMLASGWAWEAGGAGMAFSLAAGVALAGIFLAYPLKRAGL